MEPCDQTAHISKSASGSSLEAPNRSPALSGFSQDFASQDVASQDERFSATHHKMSDTLNKSETFKAMPEALTNYETLKRSEALKQV